MRLLLDTHIWLWALDRPDKLTRRVQRELQKSSNELYLSPVSIWEAHHLARRKRISVRGTFSDWLKQALARVPLREANFDFAIASAATRIHLPQADIGDLFLAATASQLDLTLVTADSQLVGSSWLKILPNE